MAESYPSHWEPDEKLVSGRQVSLPLDVVSRLVNLAFKAAPLLRSAGFTQEYFDLLVAGELAARFILPPPFAAEIPAESP